MAVVLVLEDDRVFRAAIRYYLEVAGLCVLEAASFTEAVTIVRTDYIDCLVTDYYFDGGTVQALLRELHRKHAATAFIVVSGSAPQPDTVNEAFVWLTKPVDLALLERHIRRACDKLVRLASESAS